MKKGFTLVELLFVMAIIAILAGFAIANLKDSTKVATENSMKNDLKNGIATQHTYFAANQAYDAVTGIGGLDDTNGVLIGDNGTKFTVSKNNNFHTNETDCGDGTIGFTMSVINDSISKTFEFSSCEDGTIHEVISVPTSPRVIH